MRRTLDEILKAIDSLNSYVDSHNIGWDEKYDLVFYSHRLHDDINDSGYYFRWNDPDGSYEDFTCFTPIEIQTMFLSDVRAYMRSLNEFADKHRALLKTKPMQWVKFSERFPNENDKTSVSVDDQVIVRGRLADGEWYCESERLDTIREHYDRNGNNEWLEGAFQ